MKGSWRSRIKRNWHQGTLKVLLSGAILVLLASSCEKGNQNSTTDTEIPEAGKEKLYTCPMHPEIVRKEPGACPICHMDLVLRDIPQTGVAEDSKTFKYSVDSSKALSATGTIKAIYKVIKGVTSLPGYITYQAEKINTIASKVEGRIERLYVKSLYQKIMKGQPLLEIYSHSLLTAQKEYLFLKKDNSDENLLRAAKQKLLLMGMSAQQVDQLKEGVHIHSTTTLYSSYTGIVIANEMANNTSVTNVENSMLSSQPMPEQQNTRSAEFLRVGEYVPKGSPLFQIADVDKVWGIFEIFSNQLSNLRPGLPVEVYASNINDAIAGKIDFIEPVSGSKGTTKLRVLLNNRNGNLKRGSVISGRVTFPERKALVVPFNSVLNLGNSSVVFVKGENGFIPKKVVTGIQSESEIEIISGIAVNDFIAGNAGFMVDSEGLVKVNDKEN